MPDIKTFSKVFNLDKTQQELDFVNIPLDAGDIPLFIDPYAISLKYDEWSIAAHNDVIHFFQAVIDDIRQGNRSAALAKLGSLIEPNYTRLGFSTGVIPHGRGVSGITSVDLYDALAGSTAVLTGFIRDLEDCELLIPGIGKDKISDTTTDVIKKRLVQYTSEQCALHNVPTQNVAAGMFWNETRNQWVPEYCDLPIHNSLPIILVPKRIVRRKLILQSQDYYNNFVLDYLQEEEYRATSSLVRTLRSGEIRPPYKKTMKEKYPLTKDFLYDFSKEHQEILDNYKKTRATQAEPISNEEITELEADSSAHFDPHVLKGMLDSIQPGNGGAHSYHNHIIGILNYIFYPALTNPKKEQEINQGRKRIDICYTNSASIGFFELLHRAKGVPSPYVFFECKNYNQDLNNPEIDQMSGRFNPNRGRFGIITCRTITDRDRIYQSCKDTASDDRGWILVLDDNDLKKLIDMRTANDNPAIDNYLDDLYKRIVM